MIAIMFWVGLGGMIIGWLSGSIPLVIMGAALFVPAGFAACLISALAVLRIDLEDAGDEEGGK